MSETESVSHGQPAQNHRVPCPMLLLSERRRLARLESTCRQRVTTAPPLGSLARGRAAMRRGVVTLWIVLAAPAMLLLLCVVADLGKVWLARAELTTALEAASITAVQAWGDNGGG